MVQKKLNDMTNGATKYRDQQNNMSFQRKDTVDIKSSNAGKGDGKMQNGNANSFRTDSAISGGRIQGERVLQPWVPDTTDGMDGALESTRMTSNGGAVWDQFAENERRFGLTTDYDENIYTTAIDKSHPLYRQRLAEAERKAREIERSATTNAHVAEERVADNVGGPESGLDEEDRYSGVRRQDFPPLTSSANKYTPPAKRAPSKQATVSGAPVDPAIISSQLARPDKLPDGSKPAATPSAKVLKPETTAAPTASKPSFGITATASETKATPTNSTTPATNTPASASRTASPQKKPDVAPNATATVERDVASAFKTFASQQRKNVDQIRMTKARNDKEIKLNDLKKFANSFKLNTPVPTDLVSIIAKDPVKQKEIQEKAKRNAEEAAAKQHQQQQHKEQQQAVEATKPATPATEPRQAPRAAAATQGTSPAGVPGRQNQTRGQGFGHQSQYSSQSFRDRPTQPSPAQQSRLGGLTARLKSIEQNKHASIPVMPIPVHETRIPPTGPSHPGDASFSRRSSGVASAQGARLNPNSTEFRPSPFAATFNPNGNPSSTSSPRSAVNTVQSHPTPPVSASLLRRKPIPEAERPSPKTKFNAFEHIKTIKPGPEKNWKATGGVKPAFDTPPTWRQLSENEKPDSTMNLTYTKLFEMTPFPTQAIPIPAPHVVPQPHQHQLPFHLQQGVHNLPPRQSPRQPPMNLHSNQHAHGPSPQFVPDEHRMMPSHSAQSFASPRLQNATMAYPSPMNQAAQLAYNPQMMPYHGGAPPMSQYRSLSQSHQFMPPQPQFGPAIMMNGPNNGFMGPQMGPGPQMMYPPTQGHFIPPGNGHPPVMPGVNGYPSPGRGAPMMISQGSQQGHQQPMYGINGMSPGQQYGTPIYAQPQPGQLPMRGYPPHQQFGTSPQQMHQYGAPHRNNNHPNGNYNNKNYQSHGPHQNGPPSNQVPAGPQTRGPEGNEEAK
ncbi:hypothetical protein B7463_g4456, partial [Scytalidium lignicola]